MSTNQLKPRPQPKTEQEWTEVRRERYRNAGSKGGFRVLPTKVLDSDAFNDLSKSAKIVLILSLAQLDCWYKKKHKHQQSRPSSVGDLRNDGRFSLPNNFLKARGIKGTDTIASVRKELVAAGFWEVVETGSLVQSGVFRWSDNWLMYNQKNLHERKSNRVEGKQPGTCLYPNIIRYNEDYEAIKNNWNPEKFGLNPDGTPRQSYAPVMPQHPYASSVTFRKLDWLNGEHFAGVCPSEGMRSIPVVSFDIEHDLIDKFLL